MTNASSALFPHVLPTSCDVCGNRNYVDCAPDDCECKECSIGWAPTRTFDCRRQLEADGRAISMCKAHSHRDTAALGLTASRILLNLALVTAIVWLEIKLS